MDMVAAVIAGDLLYLELGGLQDFGKLHAGVIAHLIEHPDHVLCGEFVILAKTGSTSMRHPSIMIAHEDFIGKYPLDDSRTLNQQERALVPVLPAWYVIPNEVVSICKHATRTTKMATPMRNFLLRGPAGTGKTMSDYLTSLRIGKAKDLLATTGLELSDICLQCGYADQSSFIRAFKAREGMTPGKYRESARTKK